MNEKIETRILLGYNQFLCAESLAAGERFSLSLFEDLNKLIEAVVLYDKLVVLEDYPLPSGILATPLENAGILETMPHGEVRKLVSEQGTRSRFHASMLDALGEQAGYADDATPNQLLQLRISPNVFDQYSYNNLFDQTIACNTNDSSSKFGSRRPDDVRR